MIELDGSVGEGGGQMLRSALSLSMLTGKPFTIRNIRAGRKTPGILRQHLTAINAAAAISASEVEGGEIGGDCLVFKPGKITGGEYRFAVGSAGSAMLVLQTILIPLLEAEHPSRVVLEGGTHNPAAPPFEFVQRSFLPLLVRCGARVSIELERAGFFPAGGGRVVLRVEPSKPTSQLSIKSSGKLVRREGLAIVASLPGQIAKRELNVLGTELDWPENELRILQMPDGWGPGNVVHTFLEFENITNVLTAFGERGVSAEDVAKRLAAETVKFVNCLTPVCEHLADQLLLVAVWSGGAEFNTVVPTQHFHTNVEIIRFFLPFDCAVTERGRDAVSITCTLS